MQELKAVSDKLAVATAKAEAEATANEAQKRFLRYV
jgi:hypothetical protein